jgi:membrane protein insertase Oxa1/YidC/SpoIIIJ
MTRQREVQLAIWQRILCEIEKVPGYSLRINIADKAAYFRIPLVTIVVYFLASLDSIEKTRGQKKQKSNHINTRTFHISSHILSHTFAAARLAVMHYTINLKFLQLG